MLPAFAAAPAGARGMELRNASMAKLQTTCTALHAAQRRLCDIVSIRLYPRRSIEVGNSD